MTYTAEDIAYARAHLSPKDLAEFDRHLAALRSQPVFVDAAFPTQGNFIEDSSRLIAVLCTRRAAKSYGNGLRAFKTALARPNVKVLITGLTRLEIKAIFWGDILKPIDDRLNLNAKFHETELTVTLPNKSTIRLLGVDVDEQERNKVLGQKFALVIVDEAQAFSIDLHHFVYAVLRPATIDLGGTIVLSGTPGNLKKGLFFEVTQGQDPGNPGRWEHVDITHGAKWSGHRWSTFDNPHMREVWTAEITEKKALNPRIEETPIFQQEYLGRWVIDDSKLVYRYLVGRNDFNGKLVDHARGRWHFVVGCDLGYNDPTSFSIWAYHDHDPIAYCLKSEKHSGLDITAVAEKARAFALGHEIDAWVIDGANKQAVEELRRRHGLPWKAADKTGKSDFIEIMNAAMISGHIKVDPKHCAPLVDEWNNLIWDERSAKREEHPGCANHCADGSLYAWRLLYSYRSQALVKQPDIGSPEWQRQEDERMREHARLRVVKQQDQQRGAVGGDPFRMAR